MIKCDFHLRPLPRNLNDCLNVWLKTFQKTDKRLLWLEFLLCFGLYGNVEMILLSGQEKHDPMTLVRQMCNWILDWSILHEKKLEQKLLMLGAKLIERLASEVYRASQG